ncbi:PREDICTED: centromere-associated protein E-like [Poecilia mexicana]|uniref:centromere-associated protein E-like n=1 Tax=Poecilia mexicana TaxID=48701 RepID=UPI00072E2250|nr:PREDICTED: centromere-associated protein E-like [Poecilia mexicana]
MAGLYDEGRDTEEASKLLCSDQKDSVPRPDHCDLLLDAIDRQLDQLQIMSPKPKRDVVPTSKTGKNENTLTSWDVSVNNKESRRSLDVILRGKEETKFCRDQVAWRLQRLLGETLPLSESICSEADLSPFGNTDQPDSENKTERTEISDSDTHESDQNWQRPEERRSEASDTAMARGLQSNRSDPEREDGAFLSDSRGGNMSRRHERAGAGEGNKTPLRPGGRSSGVATWSFGDMSTDGNFDLDITEQVRRRGACSFMEDVGDLNASWVEHCDSDSAGEEEGETQFTAARRFPDGREQKKSFSASSNSQQNNRKTDSENKDSSEDIKNPIRTSTPVKTSERQLSDCINVKEEVFDLRRKCENEEKMLRSKWIQLKEVELCLSELRQKKKEAARQLEQLSADTTWMQKEKRSLEFVLRNSRYQLQQLQRQTESHLKTVFWWKKQLEELHEELHRAGSSPLNRCACQQKQLEKRHQTEEPPDVQVSELQHELGECRIEVGTLGQMLAQKELQLTGLQEERDSLQADRDDLMRELQLYRELEEAQVATQQELNLQRKEKDQALKARLIQEHIEELRSLKRVPWSEGGAAACLCRQLKAREQELRQLKTNTAQWKQQTAARLADGFAEQLTADLERCKTTLMRCSFYRNASKMKETSPDGSTMSGAKESQEAVCSHLHHAVVCAAAHVPSDISLFQLLCSLQSRVKQLQVFPDTLSFDVSGSSLTTARGELPKGDF